MTHPEIPEEAVAAVAAVLNDWFDVPVSAPAVSREALTAALPHLRVQETPAADVSAKVIREHEPRPFGCACGAQIGDDIDRRWHLVNQAIRAAQAAAPAPRPVVDREALIRTFLETFEAGGLWDGLEPEAYKIRWRTKWATTFADRVLALLPTEEDTKGEGS